MDAEDDLKESESTIRHRLVLSFTCLIEDLDLQQILLVQRLIGINNRSLAKATLSLEGLTLN